MILNFIEMSFAGHALDMIKRIEQNRAMMTARRSKFNDLYEKSSKSSIGDEKKRFRYIPPSAKEIVKIQKHYKRLAKFERKREFVFWGISLIFIFIVMSYLLIYLLK